METIPAAGESAMVPVPLDEMLVSVIERHAGSQLRISIVRIPGTRHAMVRLSHWCRNAWKAGDDWRLDRKDRWNGTRLNATALIRVTEVPLVAEAMERAAERARELGWEVA